MYGVHWKLIALKDLSENRQINGNHIFRFFNLIQTHSTAFWYLTPDNLFSNFWPSNKNIQIQLCGLPFPNGVPDKWEYTKDWVESKVHKFQDKIGKKQGQLIYWVMVVPFILLFEGLFASEGVFAATYLYKWYIMNLTIWLCYGKRSYVAYQFRNKTTLHKSLLKVFFFN